MVNARGITVLETIIAFAVITILATSVLVGESGQLRGVSQSFQELDASRAASSRIEALRASDRAPQPGTTRFEVAPGRTGEETVRQLAPDLYEVEVRVDRVVLVTRIAREAAR